MINFGMGFLIGFFAALFLFEFLPRHEKHHPLIPPVPLKDFRTVQLRARCVSIKCDFDHRLALPPRQGDDIAWGLEIPVPLKKTETKWPECPQCSETSLVCMTMGWIEMKECREKPGSV